jgi:hypothetical protein
MTKKTRKQKIPMLFEYRIFIQDAEGRQASPYIVINAFDLRDARRQARHCLDRYRERLSVVWIGKGKRIR